MRSGCLCLQLQLLGCCHAACHHHAIARRLKLIWPQYLGEYIGQVIVCTHLDQIANCAVTQRQNSLLHAIYVTQFRTLSCTLSGCYSSRVIDQNVDQLNLPKPHLLIHISNVKKLCPSNTGSIYSAVFEKRNTSRTRGLHFQPVPPKVHPVDPREVHGCSQFWKRAGCEFPAFGVWPPGPRPAGSGVWGQNVEVPCGARATAANPARSMAPAVPRAPWASPPAISVAG